MALSKDQSISQYGTEAYTGWGEVEAAADAKAKGLSGGGGGGTSSGPLSVDDILNSAISAITSFLPKQVKPYEEVNPFFFDEELAKTASTAEYTPYYKELLQDYMNKVETTKSRSEGDFKRTLEILEGGKEYYTGTQRRLLDKSIKNVNEGYAGRGLFFSGARPKDIGELQTEYQADTNEYMRKYNIEKTGAELSKSRTLEDVDTGASLYNRDIAREKQYAIQSGIAQRKSEAQDEYEIGRQRYYQNAQYGGLA